MGKRILVADDSRTIQQAFAMVMDGAGYTLSFARSVDEALSAAKRDGRPDLVLSDAVLGTGSGYDLCAQLKADPSLRDVPVYILASVQTPYDEARGRKVGADGHLAKPFESQALLDAVSSVLATPPPQTVAPAPSRGPDATASRYDDVIEDEDSYGEITIERGPAQSSGGAGWAARPVRPSTARPVTTPAPSAAPAPAARAPMIGAPRPVPAAPMARPATPPIPSLPAPSQPRHTVMGFPSVRPPAGKPAAPAAPPVSSPAAAASSRPATLAPPTSAPRPPVLASPVPAAAPVVARPAPAIPTVPGPVPAPPRPVVPRIPSQPPVPESASAAPSLAPPLVRRPLTPPAPAAPVETPVVPTMAAAVDKIDQKIAALAARGPEFEAIAKLSREIIEQVVWEVVPELAEAIIRREVDRLASAKK
jgi:CheY-like chemotaxis protein